MYMLDREKLKKRILEIAREVADERFGKDIVLDVDLEFLDEDQKIEIFVTLGPALKPGKFAKGFFGMPRIVRENLDEKTELSKVLGNWFATVTPVFSPQESYA